MRFLRVTLRERSHQNRIDLSAIGSVLMYVLSSAQAHARRLHSKNRRRQTVSFQVIQYCPLSGCNMRYYRVGVQFLLLCDKNAFSLIVT